MKKLIAGILAVAMVAAMSVTAFAADTEIEYTTPDKTGSTAVTYSVAPTFTVTIPADVKLNESVDVTAENVRVNKGQAVYVALTGINDGDSEFTVTTPETADIIYTVTKGTSVTDVNLNDIILMVTPAAGGASGSVKLNFVAPADDTIIYAGNYSGTVTFTVSVNPLAD